jgi:hypothetical protein
VCWCGGVVVCWCGDRDDDGDDDIQVRVKIMTEKASYIFLRVVLISR